MRQPPASRGFALLLTLLLLALVAMMLADLTRQSLAEADAVLRQSRDLQRRWTIRGLEDLVRLRGQTMLQEEEKRLEHPTARLHVVLTLGGQRCEVLVSDEQAKANVNALWRQVNEENAAESILRSLLPRTRAAVRLDLRPDPRAAAYRHEPGATAAPPPFSAWSQVFECNEPQKLFGLGRDEGQRESQETAWTAAITCWGDGRLNVRRADAAALVAIGGDHLSRIAAKELYKAIRARPNEDLAAWLASLRLSEKDAAVLRERFVTTSSCHALALRLNDGWRNRDQLYVMVTGNEQAPQAADSTRNQTAVRADADTKIAGLRPGPAQPLPTEHRLQW